MRTTSRLIFGFLALATASQGASLLQIDFSTVAGAQAGWETVGAGAPLTNPGNQSGSFSGYTDLSNGNVGVTISGIAYNRRYDNGGANDDIAGTDLDAMYGDMLLRNDGNATVDITITGLKAGTFRITTYHLQQPNTPSEFDFIKTDSNGTATVGNFAMGSGGLSPTPFNPTIIIFNVVSNGTDSIVLKMDETFTGTGGNTSAWLGINGMTIVPEPSAALLGGLGLLILLRRRH